VRWFFCLLFPLYLHAANPADVVGWIVQCEGEWRDTKVPSQTIDCKSSAANLWHPVTIDSKLMRVKKHAGDLVVFKEAATGARHVLNCDEPKNCMPYPPIRLYAQKPPNPILSGFFSSVEDSYTRIRLTQSRSSDNKGRDSRIADYAVAEEGNVPIQKLLRENAPAGDYVIETCPFDAEKGCPGKVRARKIHWEPAQPGGVWPEPLSAGLFDIIRVAEVGGISMRTKDRGLLLVSPKSDGGKSFQELQAKVESAAKTFSGWADQNEGRQILSAYLLYLSGQFPK
jgi:hypothetical protein